MTRGTQHPRVGDAVVAGALSGIFSATMTYPFGTNPRKTVARASVKSLLRCSPTNPPSPSLFAEIVKTRLHFELVRASGSSSRPELQARQIMRRIWTEGYAVPQLGSPTLGGILGFYRGLDQLIPEAALKVRARNARNQTALLQSPPSRLVPISSCNLRVHID